MKDLESGARGDHRDRSGNRKPALENLSTFEGAGVYYGATPMEAQLCVGEDVVVVGGGNSAGQAAVFLASVARRVHVLVRGPGLAETMSRYLVRRIEENPNIVLRTIPRLSLSRATAALPGCDGGMTGPATSRLTTSGTCSS